MQQYYGIPWRENSHSFFRKNRNLEKKGLKLYRLLQMFAVSNSWFLLWFHLNGIAQKYFKKSRKSNEK